jgi:hypothetical protein
VRWGVRVAGCRVHHTDAAIGKRHVGAHTRGERYDFIGTAVMKRVVRSVVRACEEEEQEQEELGLLGCRKLSVMFDEDEGNEAGAEDGHPCIKSVIRVPGLEVGEEVAHGGCVVNLIKRDLAHFGGATVFGPQHTPQANSHLQ